MTTQVIERHFTPQEVAEPLNLHPQTVARIFKAEPGVVVLKSHQQGKRPYATVRIPESVFRRVYDRLQARGAW